MDIPDGPRDGVRWDWTSIRSVCESFINVRHQDPCQGSTCPPRLFLESRRTWTFLMDLEIRPGEAGWKGSVEGSALTFVSENTSNGVTEQGLPPGSNQNGVVGGDEGREAKLVASKAVFSLRKIPIFDSRISWIYSSIMHINLQHSYSFLPIITIERALPRQSSISRFQDSRVTPHASRVSWVDPRVIQGLWKRW